MSVTAEEAIEMLGSVLTVSPLSLREKIRTHIADPRSGASFPTRGTVMSMKAVHRLPPN